MKQLKTFDIAFNELNEPEILNPEIEKSQLTNLYGETIYTLHRPIKNLEDQH